MSNSTIPPNSSGLNKFVIDQFTRGFQELRTAIENIQKQVQSGAIEIAGIQSEISHLQDDVERLQKSVKGDNGNSITSKLITIDNELKNINSWISEQKSKKSEKNKGNIQIKVALIAGCFALLINIINQVSSWF